MHCLTHHQEERAQFKTCGRISLEYHRLHCLRKVTPQTEGLWRYLESDLIAAVITSYRDSGHQHTFVWCHDPGLHEKLIRDGLNKDRLTEVESEATLLARQRKSGHTIFDHQWVLLPQLLRTNHWVLLDSFLG